MPTERERMLEQQLRELKEACEPAEHHACLTGDCEHESSDECIKALTAWATAMGQALAIVRAFLA